MDIIEDLVPKLFGFLFSGRGCFCVILLLLFGAPILGFLGFLFDSGEKVVKGLYNSGQHVAEGVKSRYDARVAQRMAVEKAAERQRQEEARRIQIEDARKAAEDARLKRETRLREFAVKDAPALWKTYQDLQGAITEQGKRIADLGKTLEEFDKQPSQDADYVRICSMRDEMIVAARSMHTKIEDAYLAYCKFQATPSRKDYDELRRKIIEDGIKEAEAAAKRFDQMRMAK